MRQRLLGVIGISIIIIFKISAQAPLLLQTTEISGKVIDASTKEPIPFCNIRLIGSLKTEQTDPKGRFLIRTIDKVDSISFSFVGYRTRTIAIKRGKSQNLNIEMGSETLRLTEITVKAGRHQKRIIDTTANYVFHQVVKNKGLNRNESISTYRYDSYDKFQIALLNPKEKLINLFLFKPFKFVFKNIDTTDEGNVFIPGIVKETLSKVYYRKSPRQTKKIVTAEMLSGIDNVSIANLANYHFAEINAYENIFIIAAHSFLSPFAPTGLNTYFYYLTDTAQIDGRTSYKLQFVGKVKEDVALKGYAWIDSATWAIRKFVFKPNEKANLNFINDYTVKQDYKLVNNKYWFMVREELHTVGSLLKKKTATALLVTKLYSRKNIETDIVFPDSLKGPEDKIILDSARNRSRAWWDTSRFEPLTRQEAETYHISDTLHLVKAWKTYEWFGRFLTAAYADAGPISFGRLLNFVSFNNVEGWRLRVGFETNVRFQHLGTPANNFLHKFYFTGYTAYGLGDHKLQYLALTRFSLPRKNDRWQSLEAMYRYDLRVPGQNEDETLLTFDNIVTLIDGTVLSKIMRTGEFRIAYEKEWIKDFSTIASFNQKTFYDIPGVFDFARVEEGALVQIPKFNITEFTLDSRYSYNDQYYASTFYRFFQNTKYPVLMFRYTAGLVNIGNDFFTYHNLQFTLKQRLSSPIGHTLYSFKAAKIFGNAPYTACYMTQGNLGILLDKFNYNLLNEFEFITDQYISLWVEHHFDGFFLNKIPGINKLKLREVVFIKSLWGTFSQKNADVLLVPTELTAPSKYPYAEAGAGIENIAYLFRVDVMWRVTYRNTGGPNFGVKFAFQPGF
jgi:hypothetical protein